MNTDFNPPLQKYAPEGEPLHAIIEEYADSQDAWLEFFLPGCGKDVLYFIVFAAPDLLGTGHATKSDEFLENYIDIFFQKTSEQSPL